MEEDEELAAIRAKLHREMLERAGAASTSAPSAPAAAAPVVVDVQDAEFDAYVRGRENVVIDCWAPWCGPCRIVGPIVEELAREWAGRVWFAKLNVDLSPRVSQAFGIQSIPTLLVFRQARLVDRIVGALPKPQLAMQLERHFGRRASGSPGPRRV